MNKFVDLEGEIMWARCIQPELSPFKNKPNDPDKYQWKTALRPTQESLMTFMDLQSLGIKNKLGKDENGYVINFNRPTEIVNKKTGKVIRKFDPPQVTGPDGSVFNEPIGNGSKGIVTIELYEHPVQGGKTAHAARFHAIKLKEVVKYEKPEATGW